MTLAVLFACAIALADPTAQTSVQRPAWIERLPQEPGRVHAIGTADLGVGASEGRALALASDRARLEVIARLRVSVKGQTSTNTRTTQVGAGGGSYGYGERTTRDTVQVGAQAEELPGLTVEQTFVDVPGRTAYALAVLDLGQAQTTLQARFSSLERSRGSLEKERTRRARWRLRKLQGDLAQLEELASLLSLEAIQTRSHAERTAAEKRLAFLETEDLPPLDLRKCAMALRSNITLPQAMEEFLGSHITGTGLRHRDTGADFRLELSFGGGAKDPAFIYAEPQFVGTVLYRLEATARITDASGVVLAKAPPIVLSQEGSPEGMSAQFQRQFARRWDMLMDQLIAELQ